MPSWQQLPWLLVQQLQGAGLAPGHAAQEALGGGAKRAAVLPQGAADHGLPLVVLHPQQQVVTGDTRIVD